MNDKKEKEQENVEPFIEEQNGLTINYNKSELDNKFPHLITEIKGKKKIVKIESVQTSKNPRQLDSINSHPRELVNPGAVDYIRRCTTKEEALGILDYLLQRKEITKHDYDSYKRQIVQEKGLKIFIDKHGGFKSPGYYEKKFRNWEGEKTDQSQEED